MTYLCKDNTEFVSGVKQLIDDGREVTFNVKGRSMRPFIRHEVDSVVVAPAQRDRLEVGDIVLANVNGGRPVVHRIYATDGDRLTLMGDGNCRGVEHCRRSDVVGVVKAIIHDGRTIDPNTPQARRRAKLWRQLLPLRRYLLFAMRKLNIR